MVKTRPIIFLISLFIVLAVMSWRVWFLNSQRSSCYFHVVMKSSAADEAKLYYDTGSGLSEKEPAGVRTHGDQQFHDYWFQLPHGKIRNLRFDPLTVGGTVTVTAMEIINDFDKRIRRPIDFRQLKALHQIRNLNIRDRELTIITEEKANDPQISVPFDFSSIRPGYINKAFFFFCAKIALEFLVLFLFLSGFLWIWFRWPDRLLRTLMVLSTVVFGWRCWILYQKTTVPYLQMSLQSSIKSTAQLFYDAGRGFNEGDSVSIKIQPDSGFHDYLFRLPRATIFALRFDPFTAGGVMHIEGIKIVDRLGHRLQAIDLRQWHPANQIREIGFSNNILNIVTEEGASDPQMAMKLIFPLKLTQNRSLITAPLIGRALIQLAIISVGVLLILVMIRNLQAVYGKQNRILLWISNVLYLFVCILLLHSYSKGKWRHTVTFVEKLFNG